MERTESPKLGQTIKKSRKKRMPLPKKSHPISTVLSSIEAEFKFRSGDVSGSYTHSDT
jgi:hypothetical protein